MKHKIIRIGDEYQCSCGLTWSIDEPDPHGKTIEEIEPPLPPAIQSKPVSSVDAAKHIERLRQAIKDD